MEEEEEDCDEGSSIRGASFERCGNFTPDRCHIQKKKRALVSLRNRDTRKLFKRSLNFTISSR